MKKIISLILAVVCVMSLGLSGCGKDVYIDPSVTIQEVLDTLSNVGYTDIEHKEGTNEYTISGVYDFVFSMNYNSSESNDYIEDVGFEFNKLNSDSENLIKIILGKIIQDQEIIDNVINKLNEASSENKSYISPEYGNLSFHCFNYGKDYLSITEYRYRVELIILSE